VFTQGETEEKTKQSGRQGVNGSALGVGGNRIGAVRERDECRKLFGWEGKGGGDSRGGEKKKKS